MHVSFGASLVQCVDAVCALLQCVVAVCVLLQCAVAVQRGSDIFWGAARGGSAGEGVVLQCVGVLLQCVFVVCVLLQRAVAVWGDSWGTVEGACLGVLLQCVVAVCVLLRVVVAVFGLVQAVVAVCIGAVEGASVVPTIVRRLKFEAAASHFP